MEGNKTRKGTFRTDITGATARARATKFGVQEVIADVIEVYKIINQIDTINIDTFFTIAQNTGTRGHSRKSFKIVPG